MAAALTQEANDKKQLLPMLAQVKQNLGRKPEQASADSGYFSEAAVTDRQVAGIELLVPPGRQDHSGESQTKQVIANIDTQAAVDSHDQIIVAAALTQEVNDKKQLVPMLEQVAQNLGRKPEQASADAGYFSEAAVSDEKVAGIELLVPPDRQKHSAGIENKQVTVEMDASAGIAVESQSAGESTAPARSAAERCATNYGRMPAKPSTKCAKR